MATPSTQSFYNIQSFPPSTTPYYHLSPCVPPLEQQRIPQFVLSDQSSKSNHKPIPNEYKKGKWTKTQHMAYVAFVRGNSQEMQTKLLRKSRKVFLKMSQVVKTRSADQCRSHHQKVLISHHNLEEIIRVKTSGHSILNAQKLKQVKREQRTGIEESSKCINDMKKPFTMTFKKGHVKIVIEDCLIQAFNLC